MMDEAIKKSLAEHSLAARQQSYSPYSNYKVGAALLSIDGKIFTGCNVENAAYGECICAERTAVVKAISEGVREFEAIAVATENGGSPCGACRQVLAEFNPNLKVIVTDAKNNIREFSLSELLPEHFGPDHLK
jgi:cytidine deaminase